ncbi:RAMP superfamily CRISPR-associated protein [Streptomyces sp. INA 01156]
MNPGQERKPTALTPVGPLGSLISLNDSGGLAIAKGGRKVKGTKGSNPLIALHRTAFVTWTGETCALDEKEAGRRLLRWADSSNLGQEKELLAAARTRRTRGLHALSGAGWAVVRLHASVQWRLVTGMGANSNAHEIGIALHGTYGCPVLPGGSLKGMAASWAMAAVGPCEDFDAVFGVPRPHVPAAEDSAAEEAEPDTDLDHTDDESGARQGGVRFLDALPLTPAPVRTDVLTPMCSRTTGPVPATTGTTPENIRNHPPNTTTPSRSAF